MRLSRRRWWFIAFLVFTVGAIVSGCNNGQSVESAKVEAMTYLERGDFTAAVTPLRTVASLAPDTPNIFVDLGRSVTRSSQSVELLKEAQATLTNKPTDAVALTIASSALLGKDDERKRLGYLRSLVRLRPTDMLFKVTLAQELVNAFQYDEVRPLLEDLIQSHPDDPAAYYLRGQVNYFQRPDAAGLAQAESDFKRTLELRANVARTHLYLGRTYLRLGKTDEAIEHLTQAAEGIPDSPDVHFELAKAFRAAGDDATAKKAQAEFVRLREHATMTEAMVKRCAAFPDDFDLHLKTARLLMKKGDPEKAIYYVNRALTIRPGDSEGMTVAHELDSLLTSGGPR